MTCCIIEKDQIHFACNSCRCQCPDDESDRCCVGVNILALLIISGVVVANAFAINGDISLTTIGTINLPLSIILFLASCASGPFASVVALVPVICSCLAICGIGTALSVTIPLFVTAAFVAGASFCVVQGLCCPQDRYIPFNNKE